MPEAPRSLQWPQGGVSEWAVAPDWQPVCHAFWSSAPGQALHDFLRQRLHAGAKVYPAQPMRALALTPLHQVRVVIVGQDPYHGPGQAEGLAFSVPSGQRIPPSLRNMFKELHQDPALLPPAGQHTAAVARSGSLQHWARQGVLLLNTTLTVEEGRPASHAQQGWEVLTDRLIHACMAQPRPIVFVLWGAHAQAKGALLRGPAASHHQVLQANHPSPLSATRGPRPFIGCGHFSAINRWLSQHGDKIIDWHAEPSENMA